MDPFLSNNEDKNREQSLGAQALEGMPSFNEHMRAHEGATRERLFSELSANERPEGVRDEQDYREYLAEMRARQAESLNKNKEILDGIKSVKKQDDRDFLISMLPYFAEKNSEEATSDGFKIKDSAIDLFQYALTSSKSNSNNPDFNLRDDLENVEGEFMSRDFHVRKGSMDYFMLYEYPTLKKGQEIETLSSTPEGTVFEYSKEADGLDAYFGEVRISNTLEGVATKKIGVRTLGVNEDGDDAIALLALGRDLMSKKNDEGAPSEEWKRVVKIRAIEKIFNSNFFGYTIDETVRDMIRDDTYKIMSEVKGEMLNRNFDPTRAHTIAMSFYNLGYLVTDDELRRDIREYESNHRAYLRRLEEGKKLLSTEQD
ncbi:hypothetical protein IJG29_03910 [Candidatus Saccharibacteria bacterium]|nr:hypothetical protein [Candidatus Saccharibacteria bacterium]